MVFKILNRFKYFFYDVHNGWEIGLIKIPIEKVILEKRLEKIHWLKTPKNVIWADPFGLKVGNRYYIYYEEKHEGKYGIINCMVLDEKLNILSNTTIIDEGKHFSFPNVFKFENTYFMLPETFEKGRLSLYRCVQFPFEWKEEVIILNEACIDSSLFFYNDIWYLLYCKIGHGNNLFLRTNTKLKQGWEDCKELLVSEDSFNSQNGGRMLIIGEELFRVSQNCSDIYGESLVINQVNHISKDFFKESFYHEFKLSLKRITCCHTLNKCGDITLIDRRRERYYLKSFKRMVNALINKVQS